MRSWPPRDRGLFGLIPDDAKSVLFLDVDRSPRGVLFDRALDTVCPTFCEVVAKHRQRSLDRIVDDAMLVAIDEVVVLAIDGQAPFERDIFGKDKTRAVTARSRSRRGRSTEAERHRRQ